MGSISASISDAISQSISYGIGSGGSSGGGTSFDPNGLLTDLVAYWKLDEASGTRVDSHIGGYDLTDNNTVLSTTGKIGNAADFVAANSESLERTNFSINVNGASAVSLAAWVKFTSASDMVVAVGEISALRRAGFALQVNASGQVLAGARSRAADSFQSYAGGPVINDGAWHHAVVVINYATSTLSVSVDGVSYGSGAAVFGSTSLVVDALDDRFFLGRTPAETLFFNGAIDECAIWSRALSADDVTALYNAGNGLPYSSFTS